MTSEVSRASQCGRILTLLADGAEHSNGAIMTAGGSLVGQYGARLKDLRRRGFAVSLGRQDPDSASCWWYRWESDEQRAAWLAGSTATPQTARVVMTQTGQVPSVTAAIRPQSPSHRPRRPAASGMMRVGAVLGSLNLFDGQG